MKIKRVKVLFHASDYKAGGNCILRIYLVPSATSRHEVQEKIWSFSRFADRFICTIQQSCRADCAVISALKSRIA